MAASTSNNYDKALNNSLAHLKKLVDVDKLIPELDKSHILTSGDLRILRDKETSSDDKIAYLVEVLPQRSKDWWSHLLTSLKATDDSHLKIGRKIVGD